jgi:sensor histidine kinase YesM
MLNLLKKYWLPILLLSIPLWNIFNAIFSQTHMPEEESVATGTVFVFYFGLYFGVSISQTNYKDTTVVFPQKTILLTLAIFFVSFLFLSFLIKKSRNNPTDFSLPVLIIFMILLLATTIGFGANMFSTITKNKIRISETAALGSKSELQLLQSQLSPHFLFNTLNNLYGLSLVKDDKLPGLLLKLSDLLRHSVYQSSDTFVPLNDELDYIKNYIEFEKIRLEDRLFLTVNLEESSKATIAPMLLIVFVENAFKHSKNTTEQQIKIDINLKIWENNILFSIFNTFDSTQAQNNAINKNSGLGLENVKRRLELLYPDKYELSFEENSNTYKVLLQLKQS